MPRVARNIVEFKVDGLRMRAVFGHQHAEEHSYMVTLPVYREVLEDAEMVEEVTGGVLGSQRTIRRKIQIVRKTRVRTDYDQAVRVPIEVSGAAGVIKLRHLTTCWLETAADEGPWQTVGEGQARCSVKDKYDWRKGIKHSLEAAIEAAGIEQPGPVMFAFFTESRVRG